MRFWGLVCVCDWDFPFPLRNKIDGKYVLTFRAWCIYSGRLTTHYNSPPCGMNSRRNVMETISNGWLTATDALQLAGWRRAGGTTTLLL